jgi:hypothetical protein
MRSTALTVCIAFVALIGVAAAQAAPAEVYESSIKLPQRLAAPDNPGQAVFKTHTSFSSLDAVCLFVWFNAADPLDPGDQLTFTPNSWFDANPYARGPGYINVGVESVTFRPICVINYPGNLLDAFVTEFLDGRQVFKLHADTGSVLIDRIDVQLIGSTG